jgi:hypothetical protein
MLILWLAPLVQQGRRLLPAIHEHREGPLGSFPCIWAPPPTAEPRYAVGEADVTPAQFALIAADARVLIVTEADYRRPMRDAPPANRAALHAFLAAVGRLVTADTETIEDVVDRMARSATPGYPGLSDIRARLAHECACYAKLRERA